jgi:hypothetical protein
MKRQFQQLAANDGLLAIFTLIGHLSTLAVGFEKTLAYLC